jgi:predicted DNA-binding antitoxin AbrB/MazE fold protein
MGKAIECIYENNVLKPVGKVPFREGERIRVTVERKLPFEPIQLRKKPSSKKIRYLRTKITVPEEFVLKITETDCGNRENYILPRE